MPFCQKCGEAYHEGEQFCPKCGSKTGAKTEAQTPAPKSEQKKVKKITVSGILAWIIGVLVVMAGLGQALNSLVGGLLMVLGGLILLPPTNNLLREKLNIELSGWIRVILFVILLAIGMSMGGIESPDSDVVVQPTETPSQPTVPSTTETQPASPEPTPKPAPKAYYARDRVEVGNFAYTINSYSTTSQIGEDLMGTFIGENADGIFLVLDVTIENVAKESKTLWGSNIKVIDDQGRTFEHDTMAEIYLPSDEQFSFEQMQPGLPKTGKLVFDVPSDIKGTLVITSDEVFSDEKKYVSWEPKE